MGQAEKDRLWEKHRPYVEVLSQVNNSYVLVIELGVGYRFISSNHNAFYDYLTDFESKTLIEKKQILDSSIHPDDQPFVMSFRKKGFDYVFGLPLEERKNYKHIMECRVLDRNNEYVRFIFQCQIIEITQSNDHVLILSISDVSPDQSGDEPVRFRLINFKTNEVINFPAIEEAEISLTKRELEILKLVNEGMISKEISEKLSISIHTVNRHRQNILEKMNVDNVMEAINYSRKLGLISS
ncbi:MAG: LuxR C-terminal-related transcriptional regulator [Dysgonomonas sp.]|nr:LuxR C-terminal-related transcriptional regulator [Dysgonomonas sp.]